nr:DUF1272 domain-containing protein [Paenibacillus chinjuensis]
MALEMRENCEKCAAKHLPKDAVAYICTHECTFCEECAKGMHYVCPNCGGELVRRPKSIGKPVSCSLS